MLQWAHHVNQEEVTMAAYVIVDVTIQDQEKYREYVKQSPGTVEAFGGKFLARAQTWTFSRETGRRDGL